MEDDLQGQIPLQILVAPSAYVGATQPSRRKKFNTPTQKAQTYGNKQADMYEQKLG